MPRYYLHIQDGEQSVKDKAQPLHIRIRSWNVHCGWSLLV